MRHLSAIVCGNEHACVVFRRCEVRWAQARQALLRDSRNRVWVCLAIIATRLASSGSARDAIPVARQLPGDATCASVVVGIEGAALRVQSAVTHGRLLLHVIVALPIDAIRAEAGAAAGKTGIGTEPASAEWMSISALLLIAELKPALIRLNNRFTEQHF